MTKRSWVSFLLMFGFVVFPVSDGHGQATTAGLHGIVRDQTGAVIPGVSVVARHVETGRERNTQTNQTGRYLFTQLPVGSYEVVAEQPGFQQQIRRGIELAVGEDATIDFSLAVGEVNQSVVITEEAPLVETTGSSVSGLVDSKQIRDLPLNGRDFLQLALLQGGVSAVLNSNEAPDKGTGTRTSFAGARPYQTGYLLDGTDISTRSNFRTPGSAAGVVLGVDTVREFQVLVNSFSAEFGNAAGGVINAISRSGTNELHGSAFEFLRNSVLDARNFFDAGSDPPSFRRNQFGGTLGGPVRKDKAFFFGGYEGLRQGLGRTLIARVPTLAARRGILPSGAVTVAPSVRPYLNLWPTPNGRDFGDGTAEYFSARSATTGEDFWMVKGDFNLTPADSLMVRYSHDEADTLVFPSPVPNVATELASAYRFFTIEENKIISPTTTNNVRFSLNRTRNFTRDRLLTEIDPSLMFISGAPVFGSIIFGGNTAQSIHNPLSSGRNPDDNVTNLFQYQDTVSMVRGNHSWKFGGMVNRYQLNDRSGAGDQGGQYQFNSLADFLAGRSRNVRLTAPEGVVGRGYRQWLVGLFVQDDWKPVPRLALNLGLRYEPISGLSEVAGRLAALPSLSSSAMVVGAPLFENPSKKNFAPRVGFAWDVFGGGRTALRGGFGIFFDQIITNYFNQTAGSNPPFTLRADIPNPVFPNALEALGTQSRTRPGPATINVFYPDSNQSYLMQYNLSIQQSLGNNHSFTVSYVGSRGNHLQREVLVNPPTPVIQTDGQLFFPVRAPRLNPNFGNTFARIQDGQSFYHSFQTKLDRRLSQNLQFQASYTVGKSIDDTSTSHGATDYGQIQVVQHPYDRKYDRGLSNFDIRQKFVANFVYELPWARQAQGVAGVLLREWQVAGIATVTSGSPFYPIVGFDVAQLVPTNNGTRPNLVPGASNNPVSGVTPGCGVVPAGQALGTPDRYYDPCAFRLQPRGYLGNLGRNTMIGPGLRSFDFVLSKNFAVTESVRIQFRSEFFNAFNRANLANPSQIVVIDAAGPVSSAGRITRTVSTSRQLQFGLKVTF